VDLSPAQEDLLLRYLDMLRRWNSTYNLTAIRSVSEMLTHHIFDCLAIVNPLRRELGGLPRRVLDVGSGAGLPGVLIAAFAPETEVMCVDAVGKKAAFVRQVKGELRLDNLRVEHQRVEALREAGFDLIVSRAFSSLASFASLTEKSLAKGGRWLAMKGQFPTDELAALPDNIEAFHVEQLSVPELNADRCIVWMRSVDLDP
jgi:16S rRNA (guanine527-N7)-methyltransferase